MSSIFNNCMSILFLCLYGSLGLVSAHVTIGNATHGIIYDNSPGAILHGWINVSFNQEPLNSSVQTFNKTVGLEEFLKKNNRDCSISSSCSCLPRDCSSRYTTVGNPMSDLSFYLSLLQSKIVGFKITGNISSVTNVGFNVSSTAGNSCVTPIIIDLLDDKTLEWRASATTNETCYSTQPYGCFDSNASSERVVIGTNSLCGTIPLSAVQGLRIGAKLNGVGSTTFQMTFEAGSFQKSCSFTTNGGGEISCSVVFDDVISSEITQGTVCISSNDNTNYTIRFEDIQACGFSEDAQGTRFPHDFELFAKPLMYTAVGSVSFTQKTLGEDLNLSSLVYTYIQEKYNGNCNPECIVPIRFYSGVNQLVQISSPILSYREAGLVKPPITTLYELTASPALVTSGFLSLDVQALNAHLPLVVGEKNTSLAIGTVSIPYSVRIKNIPHVSDIFPTQVVLLTPTTFIALVDGTNTTPSGNTTTSSQYFVFTWNFGDGSLPITTSESTIEHTYTKTGNYFLNFSVSNGIGESSKSIKVNVAIPYNAVNETLSRYNKQLNNVKNNISTLPLWLQQKSEDYLLLDDITSSVKRLESKYKETLQNENTTLISIMNELSVLKVPRRFGATIVIPPIAFLPSESRFNTDLFERAGAGRFDTSERNFDAVNMWSEEYLDMMVESKSYSFSYTDEDDVTLFSHVVFTLQPKKDIDEVYLIVHGDNSQIQFREDYGEKDITEGYSLVFKDLSAHTTKTIELVYPGTLDINDLPFSLTPVVSSLDFGVTPGVCNNNNMCEKNQGENYTNCRRDCTPWGLTFLYLFILVVITLGIYIALQEWYKRRYESYLFKDSNQLFNLIAFMNTAEIQKMKKEDIFSRLKQYKWSNEQLNYAWNKLHGKRTGMWEIPLLKPYENWKVRQELQKRKGVILGSNR